MEILCESVCAFCFQTSTMVGTNLIVLKVFFRKTSFWNENKHKGYWTRQTNADVDHFNFGK